MRRGCRDGLTLVQDMCTLMHSGSELPGRGERTETMTYTMSTRDAVVRDATALLVSAIPGAVHNVSGFGYGFADVLDDAGRTRGIAMAVVPASLVGAPTYHVSLYSDTERTRRATFDTREQVADFFD